MMLGMHDRQKNTCVQGKMRKREKIENGGVRIGPEVHVGRVDVIKTHSTFICFKCNRKVRIFQIS